MTAGNLPPLKKSQIWSICLVIIPDYTQLSSAISGGSIFFNTLAIYAARLRRLLGLCFSFCVLKIIRPNLFRLYANTP